MEPADEEKRQEEATQGKQEESAEQPAEAQPAAEAEETPETDLDKAKKAIRKKNTLRSIIGWSLAAIVFLAGIAAVLLVRFIGGVSWSHKTMQATYIVVGIGYLCSIAIATVVNIAQTRFDVETRIIEYQEITEYAILWNRPRWVLYLPTFFVNILFAILMAVPGVVPQMVSASTLGGTWAVIAFVNVLIEQFHIEVKDVTIFFSTLGFLILLLYFMGLADKALALFRYLGVPLPMKFYIMASVVIALVVGIGWLYGLFHYTALTPNMVEIQRGLTETSDQIKIASVRSRPDTTDLLERMLGCGFLELNLDTESGETWTQKFFLPGISSTHEKVRRVESITMVE